MKKNKILRGNIYYANLNPVKGSEQGGIRPVLILQNNLGNYFGSTVIMAPISTKNAKLPTHVKISPMDKINRNSIILLEQIRVIDKCRLMQYLGKISPEKMQEVNKATMIALGITKKGRNVMKKYLVTVKRTQITSMIVKEKSGKQAIKKVDDLLQKFLNGKLSLDKIFNQGSFFNYKVKKSRK